MKRRLPPDKHLDWRDKNMPVLSFGKLKTPEEQQKLSQRKMQSELPDWKDDDTYFLKKLKIDVD